MPQALALIAGRAAAAAGPLRRASVKVPAPVGLDRDERAGRPLDRLRQWALAVQARSNHNKATCALANKLARICYATLRDQEPFASARLHRKLSRQTYATPA